MKVLYAFFAMSWLCTDAQTTGQLGDRVWQDNNNNGVQDAGEPGIPGVTVELFYASGLTPFASTTTDANGKYGFTSLAAGDYQIEFTLPPGYSFSPADQGSDDTIDSDADPQTGKTPFITLGADVTDFNLDAGIAQTNGQLGDRVWNDINNNGVQDAGESGIPGVSVTLRDASGAVIATTTTAGDGIYGFTGLDAGVYQIEFTRPPGYLFSPANRGSDDAIDSDADPTSGRTPSISLGAGSADNTIDAGMYIPVRPQPTAAPSPAPQTLKPTGACGIFRFLAILLVRLLMRIHLH